LVWSSQVLCSPGLCYWSFSFLTSEYQDNLLYTDGLIIIHVLQYVFILFPVKQAMGCNFFVVIIYLLIDRLIVFQCWESNPGHPASREAFYHWVTSPAQFFFWGRVSLCSLSWP
jgi:hypothetical protein